MIGKLDRRVTFIEPTISIGTSNEDKITGWTAIDTIPDVWASKMDSRGTTLVENDRVVYSQNTNWIIRHRDDLNVRMRLVDGNGNVYSILSIIETNGSRLKYQTITTNLLDNIYWS
tara:strand:+ start:1227 stop:1574 length:348 start_codon:yes stop_codon:yes gene_type:complete